MDANPIQVRTDLNCRQCGYELRFFGLEAEPGAVADFWACPRCNPGLCAMLENLPQVDEPFSESARIPGPWKRHPPPEEQIAPPKRSGRTAVATVLGWLLVIVIVAACAWVLFDLAMTRHWIE